MDNSILSLVGDAQILQIVLEGLTFILILHPICAGLACVAATISLFSHIHGFAILTLVLSITTALLTSVSCAVDIAIVAVAMNKVKTLSQFDFKVLWGNAPWMSLVAAVLIWIVVVLFSAVLCGCCGVSRDYWMRYFIPIELHVFTKSRMSGTTSLWRTKISKKKSDDLLMTIVLCFCDLPCDIMKFLIGSY